MSEQLNTPKEIFKDHPPTLEELEGNSIGYCYFQNDALITPGAISQFTKGYYGYHQ